MAFALLFLGLMQPQCVRETREPADDVALVVVDQSESLALAGRRDAARAAGDAIAEQLSGANRDSMCACAKRAAGRTAR